MDTWHDAQAPISSWRGELGSGSGNWKGLNISWSLKKHIFSRPFELELGYLGWNNNRVTRRTSRMKSLQQRKICGRFCLEKLTGHLCWRKRWILSCWSCSFYFFNPLSFTLPLFLLLSSCGVSLQFEWCVSMWFRKVANLSEVQTSALNEFTDKLFCAGQAKDHVHHGAELLSFASLRVQLQGGRIIVSAQVEDVWNYLKRTMNEPNGEEGQQGSNSKFVSLVFVVNIWTLTLTPLASRFAFNALLD